jgi:hypothetical protein
MCCVVASLDTALYGCVESAALHHYDLSMILRTLIEARLDQDMCVLNRRDECGSKCAGAVHEDDFLIKGIAAIE